MYASTRGFTRKRPAVSDLNSARRWSFQEFDAFIGGCAAELLGSGVAVGDRIACLSKNRAEIVALHHACARIGAIFVPLNWRLSGFELQVLIDDCKPKVLYADVAADALGRDSRSIADLEERSRQCATVSPPPPPVDVASLMLYTSGTTGRPKGVLLSERNLAETAINFTILGEVDSQSRFLCESPMFHIIGMVTSIRPAFLNGASIAISDGFIPERTLARMADPALRISHYFCVPQMALSLRAVDGFSPDSLKGLKAIFTGGAAHPAPQINAWLDDGIAIVDGYGMSEAGTVFGMPLDREIIAAKAGCVGLPTPRAQWRLVGESGEQVAEGEPGELQLKGDNIAIGYWQREDAFREAMTEDGWFRTGDILVVDEDGFFRVTDRKKDMYISGGENIYPAEVEAKLLDYPGIGEFAVVGVADDTWGEVGCLFYVSERATITPDAVADFLGSRLANYKIPRKTQAIPSLPRNGVGKVLKAELRAATSQPTC